MRLMGVVKTSSKVKRKEKKSDFMVYIINRRKEIMRGAESARERGNGTSI